MSLGEDGLIVPVVRDAQDLSAEGLARRIRDLARRGARDGELVPDEVRGGTFTITNPGQFGALMATPVINQPQVAILDLEAIVKRPVVVTDADGNDSIAIRPMAMLGLSLGPPRARRRGAPRSSWPRSATGSRRSRRRAPCHHGVDARAVDRPPRASSRTGRRSTSSTACGRRGRRTRVPDVLLLLEHPPAYTRGRRSGPGELARGEAWYRDAGHRRRRASTAAAR